MAGMTPNLVQAPDLDSWFAALVRPSSLKELGVLFACGVVAWVLV